MRFVPRRRPSAASLVVLAVAFAFGCGDETVTIEISLTNVSAPGDLSASDGTAHDVIFAPGVWAVVEEGTLPFEQGALAGEELRALAEDGDNVPFARAVRQMAGVVSSGTFGAVDESVTYSESPIAPGATVTFTIEATPHQRLSLASMFAQSNDTFLAARGGVLPLFDADGALVIGDVTAGFSLFDAGSEVNEEPGIGATQAPRQTAAGEGTDESVPIAPIEGTDASGFAYPELASMIEVRVTRRE